MKLKKLDDKINKLQEDLSTSQLRHRNMYDSLMESKRDMENAFEERIKSMAEQHQQELEDHRNNYS
jgi:DNA anti-recombination protein RmuC